VPFTESFVFVVVLKGELDVGDNVQASFLKDARAGQRTKHTFSGKILRIVEEEQSSRIKIRYGIMYSAIACAPAGPTLPPPLLLMRRCLRLLGSTLSLLVLIVRTLTSAGVMVKRRICLWKNMMV